jgi:hypothetical protein
MRNRIAFAGLLAAYTAAHAQTGGSFVTSDKINRAPAVTIHCAGAGSMAVPCGTSGQPIFVTGTSPLATSTNQATEIQSQQAIAAAVGTPQDPLYSGGSGSSISLLKGVFSSLAAGVSANPAGGSLVSRSISLAAGQSTSLFPANPARHYLAFQAPQGGSIWVNFVGGTASPNGIDCVQLSAGTFYESGQFVTHGTVNIYASVAVSISAWEG